MFCFFESWFYIFFSVILHFTILKRKLLNWSNKGYVVTVTILQWIYHRSRVILSRCLYVHVLVLIKCYFIQRRIQKIFGAGVHQVCSFSTQREGWGPQNGNTLPILIKTFIQRSLHNPSLDPPLSVQCIGSVKNYFYFHHTIVSVIILSYGIFTAIDMYIHKASYLNNKISFSKCGFL